MDHRPRSHEGSQGDTPTASPSRDTSSHSARNDSLRRMGVNPNNWNGQSSDQFVTQGESSKSHQEMDYKKQDRQERERLASELSKNYSELSNAKSSLDEARKKILHKTKELERLKKTLDEARRKKEESTKKYLNGKITYQDLKNAIQEFTNLSELENSISKGIKRSKIDLNQYIEDVKNLGLKQNELYKKIENVKHDRHMREFSVEEIDRLVEEKGLNGNAYLLLWDAASRLLGENGTKFGHLTDTEEYKEAENIFKVEFKQWQKQKKKEEAPITQLFNRFLEAVSRRKHSGQRENLS
jgi:hypothetical protein